MSAPAAETPGGAAAHPTFPEIHEETDTIQFRDGSTPDLHLVFWTRETPVDKPNSNVLMWIHGLGEHAGRYKEWGQRLLATVPSLDGVALYDQRGHGRSGGARGEATSVDELADDFVEKVSPRLAMQFGPETRVVLGGHSLGGVVCAAAAARGDWLAADEYGTVLGTFLTAPAIRVQIDGMVNRMLVPFAGFLAAIPGMKRVIKANGIVPEKLSQDEKEMAKIDEDEHMHDMASIGLGADLLTYGGKLVKRVTEMDEDACVLKMKPLLIMHGEKDRVCLREGSTMLVNASGTNSSLETVAGGLHELHFELEDTGRKDYFEKFAAYLTKLFA